MNGGRGPAGDHKQLGCATPHLNILEMVPEINNVIMKINLHTTALKLSNNL